jgi:hypothetical protein
MGSSRVSSVAVAQERRLSLQQARQSGLLRGRWVALDECRYDTRTSQVIEGSVVDSDEDLVELCTRMRKADMQHCAIVFCSEDEPPSSSQQRARLAH